MSSTSSMDFTEFFRKYHKIEDNLFLGDLKFATNTEELGSMAIKVIVSVLDFTFNETKGSGITYYQFRVADGENEDVLTIFPETNQIISECQAKNQNVLVHCSAGVSRSPSVVIAYLMSKYRKPFAETMAQVRAIRRKIAPNPGFVRQLILYEELNFTISANNRKVRLHLLQTLFLNTNISSISDRYFPRLAAVERMSPNLIPGKPFLCAKCGSTLCYEINVIRNETIGGTTCGIVYIEPQNWMRQKIADLFAAKSL
ncbi:unnamed protein product [Medioppia subpectinata]|uniref:protein-tyrosine-phosphatase n=1 Tax=Medioppia subpectinata TaxID=1979941 RepID=A0A7R9PTB1_9ACAR|nr:unnamed protein product [Medioppia subpectinata]CAG2100458.1 unnamed protein product [Medioppia subpectinata]